MPSFDSIDAFLQFWATRPMAVQRARHAGLTVAGAMLEHEAKDLIGHEIDAWPPLAAATVEQKERKGQTGRVSATDPLLATGEFRASIRHEVKEASIVLGSDDPIAPFLEFGTSRMPPRSDIGRTMVTKGEDAALIVGAHIMGAVAGRSGPMRSRVQNPTER